MPIEQINWRDEFSALRPYIDKRGGVVHVRYRGEACAPNVFLETIKSVFENSTTAGARASVRIDPEFFTTHYLVDVLQALAKKVGCKLEMSGRMVVEQVLVASGNQSDGDMDVTADEIHVHVNDSSDAPLLRDRRIAQVRDAIQGFLSDGRLMVVVNDAPSKDQVEFWRDLWNGGLKELADDGLFLLKMIDEEKPDRGRVSDEPTPEHIVILPLEFDDIRQQHTIQDLARILVQETARVRHLHLPVETALISVKAFVYANKRTISRLHAEWAGVLMDLVRNAS